MTDRQTQLHDWLQDTLQTDSLAIESASSDASFRHYYRVRHDGSTWIVMDAPPQQEDCGPFMDIAGRLRRAGINAPKVHACDMHSGFVLLTDLGSKLYLDSLSDAGADELYSDAIETLVRMQARTNATDLPEYDSRLLQQEMSLFPDWLLKRHLDIEIDPAMRTLLDDVFALLETSALEQPRVFVHRDYHSRNLMVVPGNNPGVLDFQDAVAGPITYDLVSLLRDCYIRWPHERVRHWCGLYLDLAGSAGLPTDGDDFQRRFDLMGVQRHLKASGIFARLLHRDNKPGYIKDIPRTLGYIAEVCADYPELQAFARFVEDEVLARMQEAVPPA